MSTSILGKVTIVPKGAYSASTKYNRLDLVTYNGSSFVARVNNLTGVTPVDGENWQLVAAAGTGATITDETFEYAQQAAADYTGTPPTTGWSETVPTVTGGNYLWQRSTTEYSDGSSFTGYLVARFGVDGEGAVSSVNGVSPDGLGNVQLNIGNIATVDSTPTSGSTNLVTSGGVNQFVYAIQSQLQTAINGKVPTTRKVNGHALSSDVTVTADDVGAMFSRISAATILTTDWSSSGGVISANVDVAYLETNDTPIVDLNIASSDPLSFVDSVTNAWGLVYKAYSSSVSGRLHVIASAIPDVDIPIKVLIIKGGIS